MAQSEYWERIAMISGNDVMTSPQSGHASAGNASSARQLTLVGVSSGVAAGRRLALKGNAQLEWWALFTTLDEFDTCLTTGALRFGEPLLFAQVRREFEDVLTHARPHHLDPGTIAG